MLRHVERARRARRSDIVLLSALLVAAACRGGPTGDVPIQKTATGAASGAGVSALPADDGQWVRPAKDYASTRFSSLAEIDTTNVGRLSESFSFSTGVLRGQESAPLVVGSTMYVITPYPNLVYALDLTKPGAPKKWTFAPRPERASQGVACCDVVNRGLVYDNGRLFFNTLDDHVVAIDAATGNQVWNTKVGDINLGETMTMAPLVVKGKVLVGNSGGEMGVRGWLKALDEGTGAVSWTAYGTGPDSDVLIGPEFKPFYAKDRGKDLGVKTWVGDQWKIGGGGMWGWISYDPHLDLIYYGTANPGPWNADARPGDNKWTITLFARRPETGAAIWGYQIGPHDQWDYDGINESVLVDLPWQGQKRKLLIRAERDGYLYVYDRTNGQVLSADPFGYVNTTSGVDLTTGLLKAVPDKVSHTGHVTREMCPAAPGAKDWQPMAWSPKTGLLYIPHQNLCQDEEGLEASYIAGTPYVGANVKMYAGPGGNRGFFDAWDPIARRKVWSIPENFPVWSGALVTAGDVAFYGTMDGWLRAVNARTGKKLWEHKLASGIISQPMTYRGPDGKQYVAVLDGVGGWAGAIVAGDLDPRDSSAALGFAYANRDLPSATQKGGTLHVFSLP